MVLGVTQLLGNSPDTLPWHFANDKKLPVFEVSVPRMQQADFMRAVIVLGSVALSRRTVKLLISAWPLIKAGL